MTALSAGVSSADDVRDPWKKLRSDADPARDPIAARVSRPSPASNLDTADATYKVDQQGLDDNLDVLLDRSYGAPAGNGQRNFIAGTDGLVGGRKWHPHVEFSAAPGNNNTMGQVNLFAPLMQDGDSLLFTDLRASAWTSDVQEGNFGLGYRQIVPGAFFGSDAILGVYGFIDARRSTFNNKFYQGTVGAELMTERFEFRANGYLPTGNRFVVGTAAGAGGVVLNGRNVVFSGGNLVERALPGFDVEAGVKIDFSEAAIRLNAGYFRFERDSTLVEGPRFRAEVEIDDPFGWDGAKLTLGGEIRDDAVRGTEASGLLRLRVSLGGPSASEQADSRLSGLDRLMTRRITRDDDIVSPLTQEVNLNGTGAVTDAVSGESLQAFFVANTAQGAADCSSVGNACDFVTAQGLAGAGDTFIPVDVAGAIGSVFALNNDRQQVVGAGGTGSANITLSDAAGSMLVVANLGGRPIVTGINMGHFADTGVAGLTTNSATGITGDGMTGTIGINDVVTTDGGLNFANSAAMINVTDATITSNAATGIELTNLSGTSSFTNTDVAATTGQGVRIDGGSAIAVLDAASSISKSGAGAAVEIVNAHTGTLTVDGAVAATAGTGFQFNNADGTYNFNGASNLNGGDAGIDILNGSAGTFTFGANTAIMSPTGMAFNVDNSAATVTYNGTITQNNAAVAVSLTNNTGGMVTFAGMVTASTSTSTGVNLASNNGATIAFTGGLDIDTTSGTGFSATGGGTVFVAATAGDESITTTAGQALNLNGVSIGAAGVTFDSIASTGSGSTGISLGSVSGGAFAVSGATTVSGSTGNAIQLTGNMSDVNFGGSTSITMLNGAAGVDFSGTSIGTVMFADLDIALQADNSTGVDFSGATINANVTANDFDVTSTSTTGTVGVNLSGTTGTGTIQLGDTNVAGNDATIAGVATGVLFTAASNATFIFGDGEGTTDTGSSISGVTAISGGSTVTMGSYDFDDVNFTGALDFTVGSSNLVFVAQTATGDGSGSDVDNRANVNTADMITTTGTTFVLINDGAAIDDVDGFTLVDGQTLASFGNGRTFASSGLVIPANFSGIPGVGATIADPTGNGAAVLTNSGAGDTLMASGTVNLQDFIVSNTAGGDGLSATGATSITATGLTVQNVAMQGIDLNTLTGAASSFNNTVVSTTTGNAIDIVNSNVNFTGGLDIDTTTGTGFSATGGGTISVAATAGDESITSTAGQALNLNGVAIGAGGFAFDSVSSTNAGNGNSGIRLDTLTGAGAVTITNARVVDSGGFAGGNGIELAGIGTTGALTIANIDIDMPTTGGANLRGINSTGGHTSVINLGTGAGGVAIDDTALGIQLNGTAGTINIGTGAGSGGVQLNTLGQAINIGNNATGTINIGTTAVTSAIDAGNAIAVSTGITLNQADATVTVTGIDINGTGTDAIAHGILVSDNDADGTFTLNGTNTIDNTGGAAIRVTNATATFSDVTIGASATGAGDDITGPGILIENTLAFSHTVNLSNIVMGSGGNGDTGDVAGAGIDINSSGAGVLTVNLSGTNVIRSTGQALDVDETGAGTANNVLLSIDTTTFESAAVGVPSIEVTGQNVSTTTNTVGVRSFSNNTVIGNSSTSHGGTLFTNVDFDSDGAGAQVAGGTLNIGQSAGARVSGDGLSLINTTGDLAFTTLNVFNDTGTGLEVNTKGAGTIFNLVNGGGAVDTTNGTALFLDPLTMDLTFGTVNSTGGTNGVFVDAGNASGGAGSNALTITTLNVTGSTGAGLQIDNSTGTFNFGAVDINNAAGGGIALANANAAVSFTTVDIDLGTTANQDAISISGTPTMIGFGVTTITDVGVAAGQKGIDFSGATLGGTVSFQSVVISGPNTATDSIGIDLTGVLGNQIVNLGSQVDPVTGPSSSITDLHRGVVIDNTAHVQFTFGDGESGSDTGSSINVNGQAGAFTVDVGGGTLAASSFDFNDVALGAGDSVNLPAAGGGAVFVSQTGGTIAAGTHNLSQALATITVAAAEAQADTDQTFVFVAHTGAGTIDLTGGGADGFTLKAGQSLNGFDDGTNIAFGTLLPANLEGAFAALGGNVTQDSVTASNSNGGATAIVTTTAGGGGSTIQNTVFNASGLGAADAAIRVDGTGAASPVTLNNVEISNVGAGAIAVALNNNASAVALTDVDLFGVNAGTALSIDAGAASTAAVTVNAASDIDGTTGTVVAIGGGARDVTISTNIVTANNTANVIDIDGQTGGTIGFGAVTSSGATGSRVIETTGQTGGTLTFGDVAITTFGNSAADIAISLAGTGGTATFADVDIGTSNGGGFAAIGAGMTVGVTSGDFNVTGSAAVVLSGVRANAFSLSSITADGNNDTDAITLESLGANSSFTVTGTTTINDYRGRAILIANLAAAGQTISFGAVNINTTVGQVQATGDGIVINTVSATGTDIDFGAVTIGNGTDQSKIGISVSDINNATTGFDLDFASLDLTNLDEAFVVDNFDAPGASTITVAGTTTIDEARSNSIKIINSDGDVTFAGASTILNDAVGADANGVDLGTSAGGPNTGTYSFAGLDVTVNGVGAFGLRATDSGTLNITGGTNDIISNNGTAVFINPTLTNITLQNVTSTDATGSGLDLTLMSGSTFTVTGATTVIGSNEAGVEITNSGGATVGLGVLNIDNDGVAADGAGLVVNQTGAGTLNLNTTSGTVASGNDSAIDIRNSAAGTVNLGAMLISVSSSGATEGINIENTGAGDITGSLNTGPGGAITGVTSRGVDIQGGSAAITIGQSLTTTAAGNIVEVTARTGGSATLSGNLSATGGLNNGISVASNTGGTVTFSGATKTINTGANNAVSLTSNTGATINFTGGGLDIDTTSAVGFSATGGGTVSVQGAGNSATSTTGAAVNIANTTIGAGNATFQSVSSNGATNGILLNTTGTAGGLIVTGVGTTGGSGGTINGGADGVKLTSTSNVSLSNMNIQNASDNNVDATSVNGLTLDNVLIDNSGNHGFLGSSITGLTLSDSTIEDNGNGANEHGVFITNLLGTSNIQRNIFQRNSTIQMRVQNTTATVAAPAASQDILNFTGNTFRLHTGAFFGDNLQVEAGSVANLDVNIGDGTVPNQNTFDTGQDGVHAIAAIGGTMDVTINQNIRTNGTGQGFNLQASANSTFVFDVNNNTITNVGSSGVNSVHVGTTGTTTTTGRIRNNTITNVGQGGSGFYIRSIVEGAGNHTVLIDANTGSGSTGNPVAAGESGIFVRAGDPGNLGTLRMDATITNNNISGHGFRGIEAVAGTSAGGTGETLCVNINGNTITDGLFADPAIRLEQRSGTTFHIQGLTGSGTNEANIVSNVDGQNPASATVDVRNAVGTVVINYTAATCNVVP